ncbi:Phospholipase D delta [Linum perenne]
MATEVDITTTTTIPTPTSTSTTQEQQSSRGSNRASTSKDAKQPTFLHGELDIWIHEAKSLPNMDLASEHMRRCFTILGSPCSNRHSRKSGRHSMITSDPYVSVCLAGATVAQTRVIPNCENPLWDEHFQVPVAHPVVKVEFHVKDNDVLGAQMIGVVEVPVEQIIPGDKIDDWFPLVGHSGNCLKPYPELRVSIQFKPVGENPLYKDGVGVPNTYFPLRKGGYVTLYQDAHVPDGMLPEILLDGGKVYQHQKCWEDICHAILEAHHLIYVIGWSIYHRVKLVREPTRALPSGGELTLGELLKYKSQEGVRVVMLIWDDKTSHDKFLLKTEGVMQTHDEETKKFFKHSTVHCVLAPRYASNKLSIFKQQVQVVGTLFTHHQKCVILDTQASGNNRKITSFIGGLDLCDGRYDTPEHRLFRDLDSIFLNDFHNPTFPSNARSPRQPWHDLHCKIEGPAAYDIMTNFEQRWRKAQKWRDFRLKKVTHWHDDALLRLDRISWILSPCVDENSDKEAYICNESDPERWHVQVFRSIDSGSVRGFPKAVGEAAAQNLVCGKNLKVEKSIHTAYIKAIRSAQHFIYIENQYFLGSSFCWPSYKNAGADNLVPMEIALKIASKINANERFSAYVVIPMWPEGSPTSAAVQEILFWQGQTMMMMYKIIANALEKAGLLEAYHPQDYLNFFCLGKREDKTHDDSSNMNPQTDNRAASQKYRRFMIYVHAKGMIVDDEYVIIGSANINQRSLDGSRDTEIAMGAYQPAYTWAAKQDHPRSEIYGYRMSLWAEHMGQLEEEHREPHSIKCMKSVNKIAKNNWKAFVAEERMPMNGHLMQYPIQVSRDGRVTALPGHESFPDVGGKVLGSPTNLPDSLTT